MENIKNIENLKIAHNDLVLKHNELIKCSAELTIAYRDLVIEHDEKDKRTIELSFANDSLEKSQTQQKDHIQDLEKMLFMISHSVRQPMAHILGLSNLLNAECNLSPRIKEMVEYMRQSTLSLDKLTKELSAFIEEKKIDSENAI